MSDNLPEDELARRQAAIPRLEKLFKFAQPHHVRHGEIAAQGVVSASHWLEIIHSGRIEYLRNLGLLSLEGMGAPVQAVVRTAAVEYLAPARFDESLLVRVRASYLGYRSCRFEYLVDNVDTGLRHVLGATLMVCVELKTFKGIPWPQVWRDRIGEFEGAELQTGQK